MRLPSMQEILTMLGLLVTPVAAAVGYGMLRQQVKSHHERLDGLEEKIEPFEADIAVLKERSQETLQIVKVIRDYHIRKH